MLYRLENVVKRFGPKEVLRGASWQHNPGERVGVVGRNGSGKTTLLRLILGREETDAGRVIRASDLSIASVEQVFAPGAPGETLEEYAFGAFAHLRRIESELRRLEHALAEGTGDADAIAERYDRLQHQFEHDGGYAMHAEVERILGGIGFSEAERNRPVEELSGGQKSRAMLARALLSNPDLLLLDEPTNHLDYAGMEFLEEHLLSFRGAFLGVSHDRRFLNRVCTKILEIEAGRLSEYPGNYEAYRRLKAGKLLTATRAYEKQQEHIEKTQEFIRRNIAGQKTKQAQSRRKELEKLERLERPAEETTEVAFRFEPRRKGGRSFLRCRSLTAGYEAGRPIVRGASFEILRGERVAILGENGSGKTTLLKTLAGRLAPLSGAFELGHEVSVGYYDQELADLPGGKRVIDVIWDMDPTESELSVRSYLALFDFREEETLARVAGLSGGEKGRLSLAVVMRQGHNFLLLDEPTNHLDLPAREALEAALSEFSGSLLFVSHDREFVDRLASRVLDIDRGFVESRDGNYSETATWRRERRQRPPRPAPVAEPAPAPPARAAKGPAGKGERERRRVSGPAEKIARLERRIAELEASVAEIESRLYEEGDRLDAVTAANLWKEKEEARRKAEALFEEWSALSSSASAPA